MKFLKAFICILVIISFLCSCNTKKNNTNELINIEPNISSDIDYDAQEQLTIILEKSVIFPKDEEMGVYASELLAEAGFNVEFIFYDIDYLDFKESYKKYKEFLREEIDKGKNIIFEAMGDFQDMISEELLYQIGESESDKYFWHIGSRKEYSYQGIYVLDELEKEYGKPIESIEEYNGFLIWVKNSYPSYTPGLITMMGGIGETYNPISLFAQADGYTRADLAIGGLTDGGLTQYIRNKDLLVYDSIVPVVYEAVELPFFHEMDLYLSYWNSLGLIEFNNYAKISVPYKYASIAMNMYDTTNYYGEDYEIDRWQQVDVSDYNLHILSEDGTFPNSPMVIDYDYCTLLAISSKSESQSLAVTFLEWIYENPENYKLFMFGKEGVDYENNNGKLTFLSNESGLRYGEWIMHNKFIKDQYDVIMPHFPNNWREVQMLLKDTHHDLLILKASDYNLIGPVITDTVLETSLSGLYELQVYAKYEKYFDEFQKEEREYSMKDLLKDVETADAAMKKKDAYNELISTILGD